MPELSEAQEQARTRYIQEQREYEQETLTTQTQHQNTIRTATDINAVIGACERLSKEHWPEISSERRDWLAQQVTDTLVRFDLAHSITYESDNRWTHPRGLPPLLKLIDYYNLRLVNDIPMVLALRSWAETAIINYYRREGLTPAAQEQLTSLIRNAENDNITSHVITFLRQTGYNAPTITEQIARIALDTTSASQLRVEAIECLAADDPATATLVTLSNDQELSVRDHAFRHLIKRQHQATICRALATLSDDDLRAAEVPFPGSTPLDWIGNITASFAIDHLRRLRERTLTLNLWRVTTLVTSTIATIHKAQAAATVRQQLPQTPPAWQQHFRQEADNLERAARIEAVQQTPFDQVIRKLKGATSMIRIKVWCEGSTDRPIFRRLPTGTRRNRDRRNSRFRGRLAQPPERAGTRTLARRLSTGGHYHGRRRGTKAAQEEPAPKRPNQAAGSDDSPGT